MTKDSAPRFGTRLLLWPFVLDLLATAETALAIFQWRELKVLEGGGETVCGVSGSLNCDVVWTSGFAHRVHDLARLPIAALGLIWGLTAVAMTTMLIIKSATGPLPRPWVQATRVVGIVGALSTITWFIGSLTARAVCPTCLGTYALVLAFAGVALFALPRPIGFADGELGRALGIPAAVAVAVYVVLVLVAGSKPPAPSTLSLPPRKSEQQTTQADGGKPKAPPVEEYLASLSPMQKQVIADGLQVYRSSKVIPSPNPPRQLYGPVSAPVRIVDWTDIRCGHCATLSGVLRELKRFIPEGKMAVEPRHYPLDNECNNQIRGSDRSGLRCLGAKAQICLEGSPDYWRLSEQLFAEQPTLTKDKIVSIASSGAVSRADLLRCIESPETQAKLQTDIDYATRFDIQGTPLVVINGREAIAAGPFLYAFIMAGGDPDHAAFKGLPPPRPMDDGHGH